MNEPPPVPPPVQQPPVYGTASPGAEEGNPFALPPKEVRNVAMLAHLLGLLGFLGPLLVWLLNKDRHPFIDDQGKEALNFKITMILAAALCGMLIFVFVGLLLLPVIVVIDIVFCISAGVAAGRGEIYRYPIIIRFVK